MVLSQAILTIGVELTQPSILLQEGVACRVDYGRLG